MKRRTRILSLLAMFWIWKVMTAATASSFLKVPVSFVRPFLDLSNEVVESHCYELISEQENFDVVYSFTKWEVNLSFLLQVL